MITYIELIDAVNVVNGNRDREENQIVLSLEVYKRQGEFDGTIKSAKKCLKMAGYEFA